MAGFYIHIPFCKKVCYYCDFHFVATLKYKDEMIVAIIKEIIGRKDEWKGHTFNTLYFGGGTPSVLKVDEINRLVDLIFENYQFNSDVEITLEANPDDLTKEYLKKLKSESKINRLSIGTQSFIDKDLKVMNRRHNGEEAYNSIKDAQDFGFDNINIDLIYGVPGLSNQGWIENIDKFLELNVPHLSAYHLTFEPKTVFEHMRKKGEISPVGEKSSQEHYSILTKTLNQNGFIHYEISNFAKEGFYSKHNNNYWFGSPYIGVGPSAHSFDGENRSWNISNNTKYCEFLESGNQLYRTKEILTGTDRFNEYILTSLRTIEGVDFKKINKLFGEAMKDHVIQILNTFEQGTHYEKTDKGFKLSEKGWLIAVYIMREFFYSIS